MSAGPLSGRFSIPLTSARNHDVNSVRSKGNTIASLKCSSNPNSSTRYSPVSRRRTNSATAPIRRPSSLGSSGFPGAPSAAAVRCASISRTTAAVSSAEAWPPGSDSNDGCRRAASARCPGRRCGAARPGFPLIGFTWALGSPATLLTFPRPFDVICLTAPTLRSSNGTTLQRAYPSRIDDRSQTSTAKIVIEGLERSPLRAVAEIDTHASGVHDPAVTQVVQLLAIYLSVVIYPPKGIHREKAESRHRQRDPAGSADRLRHHDDAVGADVERAGPARHRAALQRAE